ncbi:hypothetical protein LOD99_1968 [Oopsacas minuta]|uniref:Uncharacterized protein n=1 Tax=Oopsacas minuta TaxID=111878 RepID=A0AAV7K3Q5_9METZ|nr:hypothetical protein LOD99_1935 [Oopsacas minuta]KAI6655827.1 hypothetical protein LOD99_1968 [Oopsacas minuta]
MSSENLDSFINALEVNCSNLGIEDSLCKVVLQQIIKSYARSSDGEICVSLTGRGRKSARINDDLITALCRSWGMSKLVSIDLSYNSINMIGIEQLSEIIKEDKYLERLDLSFNDFDGDGVDSLIKSLHFNSTLKHLNLSGCKLGLKGGLSVASMLQVNQSLKELLLSSCDINTDVVIALATVLSFNQSIQLLDISRPILFSRNSETTTHLGKMLNVNKTLKELRLSKHNLTDFDMLELCNLFKDNKSIVSLDFSCNKLAQDGAKYLSQLLKFNTTIKYIDLTANRIGDQGLIAISEVIRFYNSTLGTLMIGYNNIGDAGLCHFSVSLFRNDSIKSVSIWGNKLGIETCEAFSGLLESIPPRFPLDKTYIDVVPYSVDGVIYLAELN